MTAATASPRAFVARFKEVDRWDYLSLSLNRISVRAPLVPVGDLFTVRKTIVSAADLGKGKVSMVDRVSFDGEIFAGRTKTRMTQFLALPGDLVVSKIRARQGSVGLVEDRHGPVSATIHYRALTPDRSRVDPKYAWLVFRSGYGRAQFLAATGGAMKGEISEEALLCISLPFPQLSVQRAIVRRWQDAQAEIAQAAARADKLETAVGEEVLRRLGLAAPTVGKPPKVFAVWWKDLAKWAVNTNQQSFFRLDPAKSRYPTARLGEAIADLENGWSPKCLDRPAEGEEWGVLKLGAVSFGIFNEHENKALPKTLSPIPSLEVKRGDFLISRANITRLVGACAVVPETPTRLMLCDKIFRAVWREPSPIDKDYLAEVLKTPHLRQQIENNVTGTSATMKNITKPALLALRLPLPPLDVQRGIVDTVNARRAEIAAARQSAATLSADVAQEVEEMILGTRPVPDQQA